MAFSSAPVLDRRQAAVPIIRHFGADHEASVIARQRAALRLSPIP
jgi:hypothetical protein